MAERKSFTAYDYKEIEDERNMIAFLGDGYENFGWEIQERIGENQIRSDQKHKMVLQMRRNRNIMNKPELLRLERHFEDCVRDVKILEKSKQDKATLAALAVGIVGTGFVAGSVFAVTAQTPLVILTIVLAIPGFAGWILPCFLYKWVRNRQTKIVDPLIEKKYDEIFELCEKGNKLLNL